MTYTPKDIEALLNVSPEALREQRGRFADYAVGTRQENGRWTYSAEDMIQMACIPLLEPFVPNQYEAARYARWISAEIAKHVGLNGPTSWGLLTRSVAREVYPDEGGVIDVGKRYKYAFFSLRQNPIISNNPGYVADLADGLIVHVVNLPMLAASLPDRLIARLLADEVQ